VPFWQQFEVTFRNRAGEIVAGVWFRNGVWRISTDHLRSYATKEEALQAWEQLFDHETGLRKEPPIISSWRF